jgi:hypothetical protein
MPTMQEESTSQNIRIQEHPPPDAEISKSATAKKCDADFRLR